MNSSKKYEYLRIDELRVISMGIDAEWLRCQPDIEYREDYLCWFVLKGSRTHTLIALKYGDCFD
jgi:hypothetical protein